ncbi:nucleotide sugar dehydrogenase [Desulfonatronum parangueonense]
MASDLQYWEKTARRILECTQDDDASRPPRIIVEKSTLPVKTALAMERILHSNNGGSRSRYQVLSNPEFLAEGTAIKDLENPDRVVIGSRLTPEGIKARNELVAIYAQWVEPERIITSDIWSSELSKLVANAFLAQRISSINSISALCEQTDADISHVARAVGTDTRIGPKFLNASIGFGGSCFKKDILNLVYICRSYGLDVVADYWEGVIRINDYQKDRFVHKMIATMFNTLAGKRICLMGFAFKADTGDTRESPAIHVTQKLVEEHAEVVITDPKALVNASQDLADLPGVSLVEDVYEAVQGCHALAVMTEWNLYQDLDYQRIHKSMGHPAFIFDGRNILNHNQLHSIGFNVFPLGKPALTHL